MEIKRPEKGMCGRSNCYQKDHEFMSNSQGLPEKYHSPLRPGQVFMTASNSRV
jgi:hypothetical protein